MCRRGERRGVERGDVERGDMERSGIMGSEVVQCDDGNDHDNIHNMANGFQILNPSVCIESSNWISVGVFADFDSGDHAIIFIKGVSYL